MEKLGEQRQVMKRLGRRPLKVPAQITDEDEQHIWAQFMPEIVREAQQGQVDAAWDKWCTAY
eukprot:11108855-Prorocentrum_lima.AAC.1